jgi:Family of unknown function (DUF5715)
MTDSGPHPRKAPRKALVGVLLVVAALAVGVWVLRPWQTKEETVAIPPSAPAEPAPTPEVTQTPDPLTWAAAVARVEEARGSNERLDTPAELMHYQDRRRFLAMQMADTREEEYELPHDQAELAQMIARGELVEVKALGSHHLLYDVGTSLREDPLVHYDVGSGKDVPLFGDMSAWLAEDERLAGLAAGQGRPAAQAKEQLEFLASFYGDPNTREALFREHAAVTSLTRDFGGVAYDLADPGDRTRLQVRLLSFVRPEAREVVLEVARRYHERFDRLLPVTSLVRTQRYQRRLSRVNPNAARVDTAPHTTGMAFDISYKYLANDEQNFVMDVLAELERDGRIEALRERRNHFHVYAFSDGERPSEPLVASLLDDVEAANPGAYRPAAKARKGAASGRAAKKPAASRSGAKKPMPRVRRTSNARRP